MAWEIQIKRRPQSQQNLQFGSLAMGQSEASFFKFLSLLEKGKEGYDRIRSYGSLPIEE